MKTLYLYSHGFPDPNGHTTVDRLGWHYLQTLAEHGPVDLFALLPFAKRKAAPPKNLATLCRSLYAFPAPPSRLAATTRLFQGLLRQIPPMLSLKWHPEAIRLLQRALAQGTYDLWIANSPLAMGLIPTPLFQHVRKTGGRPRLILATEEVLWHSWKGYSQSDWRSVGLSTKLHARFHRWMSRTERAFSRLADRILCLSPREAQAITTLDPRLNPQVIPLFVDTSVFLPSSQSPNPEILFTGFFGHPPNREAALELGRTIWPAIRSKIPYAHLHLAGCGARSLISRLNDPSIEFSDSVPSLVPLYQRAAAVVGPIRSGEGVRGKFLEALSCGCPVVTTPLGASGIQASPTEGLFIAETPDEFAEQTVSLLQNRTRLLPLRQAAAKSIQRHHSIRAWKTAIEKILTDIFSGA